MTGSHHGRRHGPVGPAQPGRHQTAVQHSCVLGARFQGGFRSHSRPSPSLGNLGQHAPPGGLAALERAKAGGIECAVSSSIAGRSLLVRRNGNLGDRRGEESCLPFRIADQQLCYESAVSPGSSHRNSTGKVQPCFVEPVSHFRLFAPDDWSSLPQFPCNSIFGKLRCFNRLTFPLLNGHLPEFSAEAIRHH